MILHFTDPIDGRNKTFEVYQSGKGIVVVAVYRGVLTEEQLEEVGREIDDLIALTVADWVTLFSAVDQEAKKP